MYNGTCRTCNVDGCYECDGGKCGQCESSLLMVGDALCVSGCPTGQDYNATAKLCYKPIV